MYQKELLSFSRIVSEDENEMYFRVKIDVRYPTGR